MIGKNGRNARKRERIVPSGCMDAAAQNEPQRTPAIKKKKSGQTPIQLVAKPPFGRFFAKLPPIFGFAKNQKSENSFGISSILRL